MVWEDATARGLQVLSQLSPVQSQAPCVSGMATSPVPADHGGRQQWCTGSHSGHEGVFQLRFLVREVVSGCSCRAPGCSRATARAIRIRFNGHRMKPWSVGPVAMKL